MARASTKTKLSLDRWAQLMGIHPLHFNGVTVADLAPAIQCPSPWLQHAWQGAMVQDGDRTGREEVAVAIRQAEDDIERLLRYRLLPDWEVDEWSPTVRPRKHETVNLYGTDIKGYHGVVRADWGYFIQGGVCVKTAVLEDAVIAWSDVDGDGYTETGTVTAPTSVTDECEIALYYPSKDAADEWEIRPTNVSISGGVVTVTFARHLTVLEALHEAMVPSDVNGLQDANFLGTVDIYRRYNDPQTQATLMWEPLPGACDCGSTTCPACTFSTQTGCLTLRGAERDSMLAWRPASWDAANEQFTASEFLVGRQPDVVRLYYQAGLRPKGVTCPMNQMGRAWEQAVAAYAAALLSRTVCDCERAHANVERWQRDLALTSGGTQLESFSMSAGDLDNPLGTRAGAIFAWKRIKDQARSMVVYA